MINTNIYFRELREYRNSVLIWCVAIGALVLMGMAFFPMLMQGETQQQLKGFLESPFMKTMLAAMGTSIEILSNVLGFYATRIAMFTGLMGGIFAINLGAKILAREEKEQTAEFLLAKPVTRIEVVGSKVAAFLTCLVFLNVFLTALGLVLIELFKGTSEYSLSAFFSFSTYIFLLTLLFGALGFVLSILIKRGRPVNNISLGIVLGTYFIELISNVTPEAQAIGYLSPFKFVPKAVLSPGYGIEGLRLLYFLGISVLLFCITFLIYRKKDILI